MLSKYKFIAMVCLLLAGLTMRCNPDDDRSTIGSGDNDPLKPKPAITTTVVGVIIDEHGNPIEGVEVMVHGETFTTAEDGAFILEDIQVPGNRCVIQTAKEGYFAGIRATVPKENGQTETRIVLMTSPVTHTFEAGNGTNASLADGSQVQIPANGLISESGTPYSGPVNMSVRYLDPTAENFGVLVPGGDMIARREDQSTSVLYSYGILRVQMTDLTGDALQLASGSVSTLIMNIPVEQRATAPGKIPLWYFDEENGVWQEEGFATREGDQYIGTVTHFTDWNCDDPTEGATIIGRLVDCEKNPAYGIVEFGQTTSDPQSNTATGETDGRFERRVPSGVQITVVISDPLIVTPLTQNERGKVIVIVPPLADGQVYDVGDIQTFPCAASVTATFKTAEGDQVQMVTFSSDNGIQNVYEPGENMKVNLYPDLSLVMTLYTSNGTVVVKNVQTPGENQTLDLGEIDLTTIFEEDVAYVTGRNECYGELETEGQISAYWNDGGSHTGINYASPGEAGIFTIEVPVNTTVEISSSTPKGSWKKEVHTPSTPGEVLDLGILEVCENQKVGKTSFTVTGDGMDKRIFTVISNKNLPSANFGFYYPGSDLTLAGVQDLEDEIYLSLYFPGSSTGLRTEQDKIAISIERRLGNSSVYYWGGLNIEVSSVDLTITKYEDVDGVIEGIFSGTFLVQNSDKEFTGETVEITSGEFSVLRYPDIE